MKWNKLYKYPISTKSLIEGNRHYDVSNEILPVLQQYYRQLRAKRRKQVWLNGGKRLAKMRQNVSKMRQPLVVRLCTSFWNIIFGKKSFSTLVTRGERQAAWGKLSSIKAYREWKKSGGRK